MGDVCDNYIKNKLYLSTLSDDKLTTVLNNTICELCSKNPIAVNDIFHDHNTYYCKNCDNEVHLINSKWVHAVGGKVFYKNKHYNYFIDVVFKYLMIGMMILSAIGMLLLLLEGMINAH